MKRIFIALICLIVFSVPFLFVGCGNPPTNPPSNIESEEPEIESGSSNGGGELPSDPEEPIIPEDPTEPEMPLDPIIPPENNNPEEPENPIEPENPDTPNNPDSDDDGSDNSSNPPVDDSLQENPPTDPTPDNNEPEIPVEPEPEPEPEPLVRFDFTIYNQKSNVVYDLENGKILVNLTENINDNIVHFNCLIYVDNNLSVNQTIIYTLTNEDKLVNTKPQNLSNFLFKFSTAGTYVLTLSNSDESCVKTINIIVE